MAISEEDRNRELQRLLLEQEYRVWQAVLDYKGYEMDDPSSPPTEREYDFAIDRRAEPESQVTADQIKVALLREDMPLEEYMGDASIPKSGDGERWIYLHITPEDPYRSQVGFFEQRGSRWYRIESLQIYLSSMGRAYQQTEWDQVLEPNIHKVQNHTLRI